MENKAGKGSQPELWISSNSGMPEIVHNMTIRDRCILTSRLSAVTATWDVPPINIGINRRMVFGEQAR